MRCLVCCVVFALVSGLVTGLVTKPLVKEESDVGKAFSKFALGHVIPSVPSDLLNVRFGAREVLLGNVLCPFDTLYFPFVDYNGNPNSLYTLVCTNPDLGFILEGTFDFSFLNLLVVNIPDERIYKGDMLSDYKVALPLPGRGQSRNVCLVYKQPKRIKIDINLLTSIVTNIYRFNITDFVAQNQLGDPSAGNFHLSQLTLCDNDAEDGCNETNKNCNCC